MDSTEITTLSRCSTERIRTTAASDMVPVAAHLALLGSLPWRHCSNRGPNIRFRCNQLCSLGELFDAAQADKRTNSVVGSPGTTTPTPAIPRLRSARASRTKRATRDLIGNVVGASMLKLAESFDITHHGGECSLCPFVGPCLFVVR